jgi:hypothetical protein
MPDKIVKRKSKGNPTEAMCRAVDKAWPRLRSLFNDARVYQYGYIDQKEVETAFEMTRNGVGDFLIDIVKIAPLEVWLRSLEGTSALPIRADSGVKVKLNLADLQNPTR